jgi:hypothetical protein
MVSVLVLLPCIKLCITRIIVLLVLALVLLLLVGLTAPLTSQANRAFPTLRTSEKINYLLGKAFLMFSEAVERIVSRAIITP